MLSALVFLACLAAALFMTGVIWFVQVIHYPLMERVGTAGWHAYHADHTRLTSRVVLVPMVVELATATWLVVDRPGWLSSTLAWLGLIAAGTTWLTTFALSVPAHNRLARGFDAATHASLVATNTVRTIAWTAHAVILLVATYRRFD